MAEKPVAKGVVVQVDETMKYAILHASGYGRVLISRYFDEKLMLGQWYSVEVEPNARPILTAERTGCDFADVSEPKLIEELLPTGTTFSKTGTLNLRVQTPVFLGSMALESSVGLSPQLGRVYLNKTLCKKFSANPLSWIFCAAVAVEPTEANFYTFWEARTALREDTDPKLSQCIRRCLGRFHSFKKTNVCVLQLFDKYGREEGFAYVHSCDFIHVVGEDDLKKARAIEVYAAPQLLYFPEEPVPSCYARIVDDGSGSPHMDSMEEEFAALSFSATNDRAEAAGSSKKVTNDGIPRGACDPNCKSISVISRTLAIPMVAENLEKDFPNIYRQMLSFIANNT